MEEHHVQALTKTKEWEQEDSNLLNQSPLIRRLTEEVVKLYEVRTSDPPGDKVEHGVDSVKTSLDEGATVETIMESFSRDNWTLSSAGLVQNLVEDVLNQVTKLVDTSNKGYERATMPANDDTYDALVKEHWENGGLYLVLHANELRSTEEDGPSPPAWAN